MGTAIGSTLFLIATASPAVAAVACAVPGPTPIAEATSAPIVCVNNSPRTGGSGEDAISLSTTGDGNTIDLTSSQLLTAVGPAPKGHGIFVSTTGNGSDIAVHNSSTVNSFNAGIAAQVNAGDSDIVVVNDGAITTSGGGSSAAGAGIAAYNGPSFNASDLHIFITNSGKITTTGSAVGIFARSAGENGIVQVANSGAIVTGPSASTSGGSTGIFADVDGDNSQVLVTNSGAITTSGLSAAGISAVANYYSGGHGDVVIHNSKSGTIVATGNEAYGIFATAGSSANILGKDENGTVVITNDANVTSGSTAIGAFSYGDAGHITITNTGALKTTGTLTGNYGLYAVANGSNTDIRIDNSGAIDTSAAGSHSFGIRAINGPQFTTSDVNLHIYVTNTGAIKTGTDGVGIFARSAYAGGIATVINSGSITTGPSASTSGGSTGIFADVNGNDSQLLVINSGAIKTNGASAAGISAIANYYQGSNGDIVIHNNAGGTIVATADGAYGIFATAGSSAHVTGKDDNGSILITNDADITSGSDGIGAFSYGVNGDISITNTAGIVTTGPSGSGYTNGLYALANGDGAVVSITNSGRINATGFGIWAQTKGLTSDPTISTSGSVNGTVGGIKIESTGTSTLNITGGDVGAGNQLAIKSESGALTANNAGYVTGRVELSDDGNTFNNLVDGAFKAITDSSFGAGIDAFNNAGILDASGTGGAPVTVAFNGLETFTNGAVAGNGPGLITLIDNQAGDSLLLGGDFTGVGNSALAVDTDFGGSGTSDQLVVSGATSGKTGVVVNVTGVGNGAPNTTGITVIAATGSTNEADFDLASGPVNAGFYAYDLFRDGNTHVLRAVGLGNAAYELPAGQTGAADSWQASLDQWQRHIATSPGDMSGGWIDVSASGNVLDPSVTFNDPVSGRAETLNLDNSQFNNGLEAGVDTALGKVGDGELFGGLMAGMVRSQLSFASTPDTWQYQGATAGAYATYFSQGFFMNGQVQADMLSVSVNDLQGAINGKASTLAHTFGGRVQVGYRANMDWGYVQPMVSLEGARTHMDGFNLFGSDVTFDDGMSGAVRASIDIASNKIESDNAAIRPHITLSVGDRFGRANTAHITGPGPAQTVTNNPGNGLFAAASVGVDLLGAGPWSGSVTAGTTVSSDALGGSVKASLHYSW